MLYHKNRKPMFFYHNSVLHILYHALHHRQHVLHDNIASVTHTTGYVYKADHDHANKQRGCRTFPSNATASHKNNLT